MKITTKITLATFVKGAKEGNPEIGVCYTTGLVKIRAFQKLLNTVMNERVEVVSVFTTNINCNCALSDTIQNAIERELKSQNLSFQFAIDSDESNESNESI